VDIAERVLALHRPLDLVAEGLYKPGAPESVICLECSAHYDDKPELWPAWIVVYPCPTVQLIAETSDLGRSSHERVPVQRHLQQRLGVVVRARFWARRDA